ncbi:deoxynucleotidyltransferase terminal-interacting protein 1 isoform X3 [Eublepharis macularius]|uniref:Deoxynucleotidyltransferase terminal-interacting protein 1 isoform X3 n=1 Tax=Eublepharis macularius TaxID=481883 RepID=A0AA97JEK8_EUBMA|nr:deoxynucleotidyltransferase terminal-interacting protein 1 isoform X3 [Eublepharis macularius]
MQLNRLIDIASGKDIMSKQELENKTQKKIHWYVYMQIKNMTEYKSKIMSTPLTDFEQILNYTQREKKGMVSKIYAILLSCLKSTDLPCQSKWHQDCNTEKTQEKWEEIWSSSIFTSKVISIRLQTFKIIHRWHLTPKRLSTISSSCSPLCWKSCNEVGSFSHCWWGCPLIATFWKEILEVIKQITSYDIPLSPSIIFLDQWNIPQIPKAIRNLIAILLVAAKSATASVWKLKKVPTKEMWLSKTWDRFILDKINDNILNAERFPARSNFYDKWFPFLEFIDMHDLHPKIRIAQTLTQFSDIW